MELSAWVSPEIAVESDLPLFSVVLTFQAVGLAGAVSQHLTGSGLIRALMCTKRARMRWIPLHRERGQAQRL